MSIFAGAVALKFPGPRAECLISSPHSPYNLIRAVVLSGIIIIEAANDKKSNWDYCQYSYNELAEGVVRGWTEIEGWVMSTLGIIWCN